MALGEASQAPTLQFRIPWKELLPSLHPGLPVRFPSCQASSLGTQLEATEGLFNKTRGSSCQVHNRLKPLWSLVCQTIAQSAVNCTRGKRKSEREGEGACFQTPTRLSLLWDQQKALCFVYWAFRTGCTIGEQLAKGASPTAGPAAVGVRRRPSG